MPQGLTNADDVLFECPGKPNLTPLVRARIDVRRYREV
jgi:hypothetical protein